MALSSHVWGGIVQPPCGYQAFSIVNAGELFAKCSNASLADGSDTYGHWGENFWEILEKIFVLGPSTTTKSVGV
jgi:hypothetical protein